MSAPRIALLAALAGAALLGAGCRATLSHTVDPAKLKEMSRQGHLWIYDAENEIVVAMDKLDEARDSLRRIKEQKGEARASAAKNKRQNEAGQQMDAAWMAYLDRMQVWAERNIELHELGVVVAQASVELAKAQVINREDLLGGKGFKLDKYLLQYERLRQEFEQDDKAVRVLRKQAREQQKAWWDLRKSYVTATGDYDRGLWID